MKRKFFAALTALICVSAFFIAAGCNAMIREVDPEYFLSQPDLSGEASFFDYEGNEKNKFDFSDNSPAYFDIKWNTPQTFNTVVLKEAGGNVAEFELYASGETGDELIYRQDKIEEMRYCCFETVTSNKLRIKVTKLEKSGTRFRISAANVYLVENEAQKPFRVTSYTIFDRITEYASIDVQSYQPVSDVILFGALRFETDGSLVYEQEGYEQKFLMALTNLQRVQNELQKKFRIYVNILNPNVSDVTAEKQMSEKNARSQSAMGQNRATLIKNIDSFLKRYASKGVTGIAFDWEFPETNGQWSTYSDFLVELKNQTGTDIAVAVPPWGVKFSQKAKEAIDVVELMAYDLPDEDGYHSNFYDQATMATQYILQNGFPKEKIDLGIPFYARPTDMAALWFSYNEEAERLGKYSNVASGNISYTLNGETYVCSTPRYYNGCAMVYDKTRYARDMGLGGIMVWNHGCDIAFEKENSLWRAVFRAINA